MSNKILFIFEGEKTEAQISRSLCYSFFCGKKDLIIECVYKAEIYQLYNEINKDEYIDTFELIKNKDKKALGAFSRDDFAEIYLFFDYDGHATKADDTKITMMLELFDNETDKGKLYISYPMVEALKHIKNEASFFESAVLCNTNIHYKKLVNQKADLRFKDFRKYDFATWIYLINIHLIKANFIVNNSLEFPNNLISQNDIFENQMQKYINTLSKVSVLSAFPLFIHDYFGNNRTKETIIKSQ